MISRSKHTAAANSSATKETHRMTTAHRLSNSFHIPLKAKGSSRAVSAAVCLVLAAALALPATSAAAAPQFTLAITHSPETFHRGEFAEPYTLTITNSGDAPTSGAFTVTDTLPAGLSAASADGPEFTCTGDGSPVLTGASVVACTRTTALAPGEAVAVSVRVDVGAAALDLAGNEATVSGGGAPAAVSASDPTPVADNVFDIESFTSQITTEAGVDSTLAGAHPFQNVTQFEFTTRDFSQASGADPDGVEEPKDAFVTLPPGFVGNPAAVTRCPLGRIGDPYNPGQGITDCPPGSQVGIAKVGLFTSNDDRPIYNLVPEDGYPAQFGLKVSTVPTILSVVPLPRSESYGLTIGSNNIPSGINFWSFKTTFYGVPGQQPVTGPKDGSGGTDAPFLSNPLDCSNSQPTWKLTADSWEQAGTYHPGGFPSPISSTPAGRPPASPPRR